MNQELEFSTTNYLSPYLFYNKFLFWLVRLQPFIEQHSPMSADQFIYAFKFQYESGLRITETLQLTKQDIDLNHRIVIIRKAKTGTNQKTTIVPYAVSSLNHFLERFSNTERIFPTDRSTMWRFGKDAGRLAGLGISEIQKKQTIDGVWTHLLRKSCSKRMQSLGASRELRMVKLRHSNRDAHDTYDRPDLNTLLEWEEKYLQIMVKNND